METNNTSTLNKKKTHLFIVLNGIFLTNALVAEIIGPKIFSLETLLGLQPAQIPIMGDFVMNFDLSAGVVIWPVVFIATDIINEYFGKAGVRKVSILAAIFISYLFVALWIVTGLPPAQFWLEVNSLNSEGHPFNINEAFSTIFLQGMGIIVGSLTAFLVSQFTDVITFQWLRKYTGSKQIWLRATGSTLVSQLIDSYVVLFIAFYVWGNWSIPQIIAVGIIGYTYKFTVAILLTPVLYIVHFLIDQYLGEENAKVMMEEAAQSKLFKL